MFPKSFTYLINKDEEKYQKCVSFVSMQLVSFHLRVNEKHFEVVEDFQYSGSLMNSMSNVSFEEPKQMHHSVKHILAFKSLSRDTKKNIYKTLIRVIALYSSKT